MRRRFLIAIALVLILSACAPNAGDQPAELFPAPQLSRQISIPAVTPDLSRPTIQWIHMIDPQSGWGITADLGRLVRTHDSGATWHDVTPDVEAVRSTSSFFLDAKTAFVEGFDESSSTQNNSLLFATHDAGKTWSRHALPFAGGSLHFQDASTGWAVSIPWSAGTETAALIYQTTDGGKSWNQLPLVDPQGSLPDAPTGSVQLTSGATLAAHHASNLWLGGGSTPPGQALHLWGSWDGGQTWQAVQLPSPQDGETPTSRINTGLPVFLDDSQAFLTATFVLSAEGGGNPRDVMAFYSSQDGGRSWQLWPALVQGARLGDQPSFISGQVAFVRCGEAVCVTHDGGASWQALHANIRFNPDQDLALEQLDFISDQVGWAVTANSLFRTLDGGKTWAIP